MQKIRVRLLWRPQAQFAGYHIAEHLRLAAHAGVELACEPIRFDEGSMAALKSGSAEMAVASPSHLLESGFASGLRFILAVQQESALVYPVRISSGINRIAALVGRRVGVWPGGEDLELRWMLQKAGVTDGAVTRVPMKDTIGAFLTGEVDCAQMTTYHELHKVEEAIGQRNLRLFSAHDVGASLLKDGLIVRQDWLTANRQAAQAAVDAILEGWTIAFTDPDRAVAICREVRPDMPIEEHKAQLAGIRKLSCQHATLTHGLGHPDPEHVRRALTAMRDLHMLTPEVAAEAIADDSLWQAAPAKLRSRAW